MIPAAKGTWTRSTDYDKLVMDDAIARRYAESKSTTERIVRQSVGWRAQLWHRLRKRVLHPLAYRMFVRLRRLSLLTDRLGNWLDQNR